MFAKTRQTATDLARQVATDFPPTLQGLSGRKALDMFQRTASQLRLRAQEIQNVEKMGLIRRIVFARTLQKELVSVGYEGALVKRLMSEALTAIAVGNY
ncbi:MAG: hypothetical protein NT159_17000 [Proteobacteria bacterium]|nr:hypothetical protein [Pseudomonadota bacterium]